jgi:hypothetical protein
VTQSGVEGVPKGEGESKCRLGALTSLMAAF